MGLDLIAEEVDWGEVDELVTESFRLTAPAALVAQLAQTYWFRCRTLRVQRSPLAICTGRIAPDPAPGLGDGLASHLKSLSGLSGDCSDELEVLVEERHRQPASSAAAAMITRDGRRPVLGLAGQEQLNLESL